MPDRAAAPAGAGVTLDLAAVTIRDGALALLLRRAGSRWELPWEPYAGRALDAQAARLSREALGGPPGWLSLVGVFDSSDRHPSDAPITIGFAAMLPLDAADDVPDGHAWYGLGDLPAMAARQRRLVEGALALFRDRLDRSPIAFRLLPALFTLTELQHAYELLLGRRLHKASFRRALHGASLVEPTGEWRSEGRGRPAQLHRWAPRKRQAGSRGVRFDF